MSRRRPANPRWEREHEARLVAVRTCLAGGKRPEVIEAVATGLGVKPDTVRTWIRRHDKCDLAPRAPGRKATEVPLEIRRGVILSICMLGVACGLDSLRARHADVPYRYLTRMKRRLARLFRRRRRLRRGILEWLAPGRVWAMDFSDPKARLDGPFRKLLIVRDLPSHLQLLAMASTGETARAVCTALESLFLEHGAPLVIKCDNGSAFRSKAVKALCREHGVELMYSPAYRPQYNGSAERGGGHIKAAVKNLAELAGRPHRWTWVDVEQARLMANRTVRPWGARGPTPDEVFGQRRRVSPAERGRFQRLRGAIYEAELTQRLAENGRLPSGSTDAALARRAIKKALIELGYLKIRGGPVSTPL